MGQHFIMVSVQLQRYIKKTVLKQVKASSYNNNIIMARFFSMLHLLIEVVDRSGKVNRVLTQSFRKGYLPIVISVPPPKGFQEKVVFE